MGFWKTVVVSAAVCLVFALLGFTFVSTPFTMLTVKTIEVKAPVEESFSYMAGTEGFEACLPPMIETTDVEGEGLGRVKHTSLKDHPLLGSLNGERAVVDFELNKKIVSKGFDGRNSEQTGAYTFVFTPMSDGGTRIVWIAEGSAYVPAAISATSPGRKWVMKNYWVYVDEFASCIKEKIEQAQ